LELVDKSPAAYSKSFGGFGPVKIMFAQCLGNGLVVNFLQAAERLSRADSREGMVNHRCMGGMN
jgi:hypothetical protein